MDKFLKNNLWIFTWNGTKTDKKKQQICTLYGYRNFSARCHQLWITDLIISFTQPYQEVCVVQHDSCESNHIQSIYSMADLIFEKSDKLAKEMVERKNITFFLYWPFHGHRVSSMLEWRLHQCWFMRSLFSFSLVSLWKKRSFIPYIGISISITPNFSYLGFIRAKC